MTKARKHRLVIDVLFDREIDEDNAVRRVRHNLKDIEFTTPDNFSIKDIKSFRRIMSALKISGKRSLLVTLGLVR